MEVFTDLAQYGIVGVCIALIIALVYLMSMMTKIVGNHINHSTEAMTKLTGVIVDLKDVIKRK